MKLYYLIWIKRQEAKFCSTTGTGWGNMESSCCIFTEKINFPHGLNGIVIARNVIFTGKATIYQHVTIAESNKEKETVIGNNVEVGAGAVILNNVFIGDDVTIGANAVVTHDVPSGCVVAGVPARVLRYGRKNGL